ncbi:V-type ATP synthase subunit I [Patescibacteria group bacterium]|nr:V-type ATP synthase subunit I [Patescibacteria group bacterium]
MAVSKIVKINLFSLKKHEKGVLDFLHRSGAVQIIDKKRLESGREDETEQEAVDFERRSLEVDFAIKTLEPYKKKEKQSLVEKISTGGKMQLKPAEYKDIVANCNYQEVTAKVKETEQDIQSLEEKNKALEEEKELLTKWTNLNFDLSDYRESLKGKLLFGKLPQNLFEEFAKKVEHKVVEADILPILEEDNESFVVVTLAKDKYEAFETMAFDFNFEEVELPAEGKTPAEHISQLNKTRKDNKEQIRDLKGKLTRSAKQNLKDLKVIYDYLTWQKEIDEAKTNFDLTGKAFRVSAWVQKEHINHLEEGLKSVTKDFYLAEVSPKKKENAPVIIENRSFIKPFESVTKIYGLPKTNEVDPTPYLAPFFIVYFALCLTDAGYGIILAVGTYLAIKVFKVPKDKQRLLRLLMYGGIATFVIGALYGGWFGIESEQLPPILQKIQVINPLNQVMVVLGIAAALGYIQILTGIIIKLYWSFKSKVYEKDVLMDALWFTILLFGGLYLVASYALGIALLASVSLIILLLVAFLVVWFSGTNLFKKKINNIKKKEGKSSQYYTWLILGNIIGLPIRLISGILGLYTAVGYISDILSYSRLLALGLATGIIAMAVNIIALLVKDMIPVAGYVLMVIILIGGHTFNIAINVLGAYIHSGRLQFVEFFPKFLEGGGEVFIPFKREGKYIEFKN